MTVHRKRPGEEWGVYARLLPPAKLFLEDLSAIEMLLRKRCGQVELYAGQARLDSAADFLEVTESEANRLVILTGEPEIEVVFKSRTVSTREDSDDARQAVVDVDDFVTSRRSGAPLYRAFDWLFLIWMPLLFAVSVYTGWEVIRVFRRTDHWDVLGAVWAIGLAGFSTWMFLQTATHGGRRVVLVQGRRLDQKLFTPQNRTTWITSIASLVVGALIGHFWT